MTTTATDLCSMALVKLGAAPISSLDDNSAEAEIVSRLYAPTLEALLVAHPWDFTLAHANLTPDPEAPLADFAHGFFLPDDLLRTVSAGRSGKSRGVVYRVVGDRLLTDSRSVLLTYQRRCDASELPPHVVQAFIARLAAELAVPITESTSRAEAMQRLARAELHHAKLVDSQQSTPNVVEDFPLVSVRRT